MPNHPRARRPFRIRRLLWLALLAGGVWTLLPSRAPDGGRADGEGTRSPERGARPCEPPIGWKVGIVDPRFGIPGAELRRAIEEAISVWERAAGRTLFAHQPVGGMPIDLVYDERQSRLDEQARAERELDEWKAELAREPRSRAEVAAYNRLVARYNAAVEAYNRRPALEFQVGEYSHVVESPSGRKTKRRIVVWAADTPEGLTSTLTHELGHALGLGHVPDPAALMTAQGDAAEGARGVLQPADLEELRRACGAGR